MEVTYARQNGDSYLIIHRTREPQEESYATKIFTYNKIEGLIEQFTIIADGVCQAHYKITGMEAVEERFQREPVNREELIRLLRDYLNVKKSLREYLLNENYLALNEKYVFYSYKRNHYYFLYNEAEEVESMNFRDFWTFLLRVLDYEDSGVAQLAYELYEQSENDFFVLEDYMEGVETGEQADKGRKSVWENLGEDEREKYQRKDQENLSREVIRDNIIPVNFEENPEEDLPESFLEFLISKCRLKRKPKERRKKKADKKKKETVENYEDFIILPEEEPEYTSEATVYFRGKQEAMGELVEVNGNETLDLKQGRQVIGSDRERADICLSGVGISRIHAEVSFLEGQWRIRDLNSTNGTAVNQKLLLPQEKPILEVGDQIRMGTRLFRFL